jgi:hypothetical protein
MRCSEQTRSLFGRAAGITVFLVGLLLVATLCFGAPADPSQIPSIFEPHSTPADSIFHFSLLVLAILTNQMLQRESCSLLQSFIFQWFLT